MLVLVSTTTNLGGNSKEKLKKNKTKNTKKAGGWGEKGWTKIVFGVGGKESRMVVSAQATHRFNFSLRGFSPLPFKEIERKGLRSRNASFEVSFLFFFFFFFDLNEE